MLKPVLFILLSTLLTISIACANKRTAPKWSAPAAAGYLDNRAGEWTSWTTSARGEGDTKTACLCCHTTVPFAMARPLLSGGLSATSMVTDQVRTRVENFGGLEDPRFELMYDFNDSVKAESLGTEAVLNALVLAFDDFHRGRTEQSASTRKAFEHMWREQTSDGSWEWLSPRFELEPWESGKSRYVGTAMAVIAASVAPGNDAPPSEPMLRARRYLQSNFEKHNLHNQLWALWASAGVNDALSDAQKAAVLKSLTAVQSADGGFSLSSFGAFKVEQEGSDGYATALVAYVLKRAGGSTEMVRRATRWLEKNQTASGAWLATSVNKRRDPNSHVGRFMSDAATAFATMALSGEPIRN